MYFGFIQGNMFNQFYPMPYLYNGGFNYFAQYRPPFINFASNLYYNNTVTSNNKSDEQQYKNAQSDIAFANSLPQNKEATATTLQVGQGAQKIKGYSAINPETGNTVYADEKGQIFTEKAFKNWEQFAKDGTFIC